MGTLLFIIVCGVLGFVGGRCVRALINRRRKAYVPVIDLSRFQRDAGHMIDVAMKTSLQDIINRNRNRR